MCLPSGELTGMEIEAIDVRAYSKRGYVEQSGEIDKRLGMAIDCDERQPNDFTFMCGLLHSWPPVTCRGSNGLRLSANIGHLHDLTVNSGICMKRNVSREDSINLCKQTNY